jgi:hypothetical protein
MRKALKITAIILGVLMLALAGAAVFVRSYLKPERLKALIIPRAESFAGREVEMEDIRVSLFRGIVVKGFAIKEKDGKTDFVRAGEFSLGYRFWPLLKRRLVIDGVRLDSPYILVERGPGGGFNFSDIRERISRRREQAPDTKAEIPLTVTAEKISVRDARFEFRDAQKGLPDVAASADMDFRLGVSPEGVRAEGDIDLKSLKAPVRGIMVAASGKITVGEAIGMDLDAAIDKSLVKIKGTVRNYLKSPDIRLDVSSRELHLDRFLGQAGGAKAPAKAAGAPGPSPEMIAQGSIGVDLAHLKGYDIRNFRMKYRYEKGSVVLDPVSAAFSGGEKVLASGEASGRFSFMAGSVQKTLKGGGTARIGQIRMKETKITGQAALLLGLPELGSPSFDRSEFRLDVRDQKAFIEGFMDSALLKANPIKGFVGFDKALNVGVELKVSPALSSRIPRGAGQFLADREGWTSVPLVITGTADKPSVGIGKEALGRGLQKQIERRLLERLAPARKTQETQKEGTEEKKPGDIFRDIFK